MPIIYTRQFRQLKLERNHKPLSIPSDRRKEVVNPFRLERFNDEETESIQLLS